MHHTDFYVLAGTVLPLLLLALLIETRPPIRVLNLASPLKAGPITIKVNAASFLLGAMFGTPVILVLAGWAEYVCLHGLETGRQTGGGVSTIWAVLGYIAFILALRETIRAAVEIHVLRRT